MTQVVIVFIARTPIGRACKGAFHAIKSPTLLSHAVLTGGGVGSSVGLFEAVA
jgi:hypothetical protein